MLKKFETIVIGTSLTELSDLVVRNGMKLARSAGARAWLVHAYAPPMTYSASPFLPELTLGEVLKAEREGLQRKLESQMERLGITRAELAGTVLDIGPAHRLLVETAQSVHADLLVVGAAEAPRLARVFGSTADRVVRKAACPVLVIRGELTLPPRRVLFPVDLSPLSGEAFETGLGLLAQVAAAPERIPELEALLVATQPESWVDTAEGQKDRVQAETELRRFISAHTAGPAPGYPVAAKVCTGFVDTEILDRIEQWDPDLVILGTHGRSGFERFLLGSIAASVVRDAWTSALIIPPAAARQGAAAEPATAHAA